MSVQFFEKALASFKKANLERREKLAKSAGYAKVEDYKSFLEGMIGSPSQTVSEIKKEPRIIKAVKKVVTPTIIVVDILDASVSMGTLQSQNSKISKAYNGIRTGLHDLKDNKTEVDYRYGVCVFSEPGLYDFIAPKKVSEVRNMPEINMGGSTALYDAIGNTLNTLLDMKKSSEYKKAKVLVNIYTDGIENNSKKFNSSSVKELIQKAESNEFTITFVGTDSDVQMIQRNINIDASNTLGYDGTAKGLEKAMTATLDSRFVYTSNVVAGKEVTRGFYKTVNNKK